MLTILISTKTIRLMFYMSILFFAFPLASQGSPKCLHIMSYHTGYAWNDGIEKGVEDTLRGHCELKKFYMNTKRNTQTSYARKKAEEIKQLISTYKPDVVIASDDNASKYVVTQYKDSKIPFIFNGVNWTADSYGFPYTNVTGMVEVAPIIPLLKIIKNNITRVKRGIYLSSDVITEHKDFEHYQTEYKKRGVSLTPRFVKTMKQWVAAYIAAQSYDFIVINNYAGINDWDSSLAMSITETKSKILTVSNYKWMMPYSMIALTKNANEQGRWAAEVAIEILQGTDISTIPITINQEWNLFVNYKLLKKINIDLDNNTKRNASTTW